MFGGGSRTHARTHAHAHTHAHTHARTHTRARDCITGVVGLSNVFRKKVEKFFSAPLLTVSKD